VGSWVDTVNAGVPERDDDSWGPALNGHGPAPPVVEDKIRRHQVRVAYRLSAAYENRLLHVANLGWFVWDGTRWAKDERCAAHGAVDATLKASLREAIALPSTLRDELLSDVRRNEKASGFNGVLELASKHAPFAAVASDLDTDPYLINTTTGTLDLRTGRLRPADPGDRITKVTGAGYDPDATSPAWERFLADALPDQAVREFLRRLIGLSLVGKVVEHILPILTGTGRNGKGTFVRVVSTALGDYAIEAEPEIFMARDARTHPTGLLDLRGARLVTCQETDEGRQLAVATVKRLTGADQIRARKMRQDFVEFTPSHLAVMITNHLPKVPANDPALWARLLAVPFDVDFLGREDTTLGDRLALDKDAVLRWAVDGYQDYLRVGLAPPAAVTTATTSYQVSNDALAQFIGDRCLTGQKDRGPAGYYVQSTDLWHAWSEWCRSAKEEPGNQRRFKALVEAHGYTSRHAMVGTVFDGLALAAEDGDQLDLKSE
jgi:putative DNA primase/helicase